MTKMEKLRVAGLTEDKPVKVTLELPASVHHDLIGYAEILGQQNAHPTSDPTKLMAGRCNAGGRQRPEQRQD
jgi:hypothetical protein